MHPYGWDREDREYFLLSGVRLYRRTAPPIPEPEPLRKPKGKYGSKKAQAQRRRERTSKRRKVTESPDPDTEVNDADETVNETQLDGETSARNPFDEVDPLRADTLGGYKWECMACSLDEYNAFTASMQKSKDDNEKNLRARIEDEVISELHAQEERRQRRIEARQKELAMQSKILGAKRSGRLAAKQDREREEAEAAEAEKQRQSLLAAARREEERQNQMDNDRRSRMMTREQRIREREMKRVLVEDQLARDAEAQKRIEEGDVRGSRHLKERIEKNKKELEEFDEDEWSFDCSGCGQHGKNFDDGEHSIACERCNVWQHSKCLGFSKSAAERDDFHFICQDCRTREEEANRPKISLKFKVGQSSSPLQPRSSPPQEDGPRSTFAGVQVPSANGTSRTSVSGSVVDGQFYPAPELSRTAPTPYYHYQPAGTMSQPSMPLYAAKNFDRPNVYADEALQWNHNTTNGNHPHAGRSHSPHAQDSTYQQIPHHSQSMQHVQLPQPGTSINQPASQPVLQPVPSQSSTPRPISSHSQTNGFSPPFRQRVPSPIINRPTMSPTQGNPDVGPIAGVPGSSPLNQHASLATPHTNSHSTTNGSTHPNATIPQSTPNQHSFSPNSSFYASQPTQPISGLSPTKQRTSPSPLPQPSTIPKKANNYATPSSSFNGPSARSFSGTPIFPPAENLAPSPQQLNREPVPTPSKQSPPVVSVENGQVHPNNEIAAGREKVAREEAARQAQDDGATEGTVQ